MADDQSIPDHVQNVIIDFHSAITDIEDTLVPFFSQPLEEIEADADSLCKAKIELMAIFAANSLHWMYLCTRGERPMEHPIMDELKRIKKYMDRLKEMEEREKAPKLDKQAARNFLRSALWEPKNNNNVDQNGETETTSTSAKYQDEEPSLVEQQLDMVLKQLKQKSTHVRFEEEVTEIATETSQTNGGKRPKATESEGPKKKHTRFEAN